MKLIPDYVPNPFEFGGVVSQGAFCNRVAELQILHRAAVSGDRTLVYGERRMGKTSLMRRMLQGLSRADHIAVYVDLWAAADGPSCARIIAKAVAESSESRMDRVLQTSNVLFKYLVPSISLDEGGSPVVQFGARSPRADTVPMLEDAFEAPHRLAVRQKKRVVVVYDEIQRLGEFRDDTSERLLRSSIQHHPASGVGAVSYFFMGSRRHLIRRMFLDHGRPLYQAAAHLQLGAIETAEWIPFIGNHFRKAGKVIDETVLQALCVITSGHPYYTQHLAHELWDRTDAGAVADSDQLADALNGVLDRLTFPFSVLWEALTGNQQRLLRAFATSDADIQPFSSDFLAAVGLAASSAHQAANTLMDRDIIDRSDAGYVISDRFFRRWIRRA